MYSTKSETKIRNDAKLICNNLAPLLGCKDDDARWSPKVAYKICSSIEVSGTQCSNVPDKSVSTSIPGVGCHFDSSVTVGLNQIRRQVLEFNINILNPYYISTIPASNMPTEYSMAQKMQLAARISVETNSTIFDGITNNSIVSNTQLYYFISHIVLSCFTIRYFLMRYQDEYESEELNMIEVNSKVIKRLIENIDYVKYSLSEYTNTEIAFKNSTNFISHQLTLLRKNLQMIQYFILDYKE